MKRLPIWVSDYVIEGVGTGAVVGVPGHDRRDFEFAQKYGLKVVRVVASTQDDTAPITTIEQVQEEDGTMINSEFLNGLNIREATEKMMDYLVERKMGKRATTYHLRDWLISRQRYSGAPIPMIYCENCAKSYGQGWQPVADNDLPIVLPNDVDFLPHGESPIATLSTFKKM